MDDKMFASQQKELEQMQMIQQTEQKQLQQNDVMQQDMALKSYPAETKLSPMQQRIYEKFLSKEQKQQLVGASQVADGMPQQDYKPKKQSVKKKASNWWSRSKRTKQAQEKYDDKKTSFLTEVALQAEVELKQDIDESKQQMIELGEKTGVTGMDKLGRFGVFFFQEYKKGENNEPLNAEELKKKQSNEKIIEAYASGKLEDRRPLLDNLVNRVLNYKFTPDMLSDGYLDAHYKEYRQMAALIAELENLFKDDPVNKEYYDSLPKKVKERLYLVQDLQKEFSMAFFWRMREVGVDVQTAKYVGDQFEDEDLMGEFTEMKNGKEVTTFKRQSEHYKDEFIKYIKSNKQNLKQLDKPMTVEEEYNEKRRQDFKRQLNDDEKRAKEEYNDPKANYLTYRMEQNYLEKDKEKAVIRSRFAKKMEEAGSQTQADDARLATMFMNGYKQNEKGEPLNEEERKKKEADEKFMEDYSTLNLEKRIPHLNKLLNKMMNIKFDLSNYTEENLYFNSYELMMDIVHIGNFQNVFETDPVNKPYLKMLPESIRERMNAISTLQYYYTMYYNAILRENSIGLSHGRKGAYTYSKTRREDLYGEFLIDGEEKEMSMVDGAKWELEEYIKTHKQEVKSLSIPMTVEEEIKKYGLKKPGE